MKLLSTLQYAGRIIRYYPHFLPWFVRNRLRAAALPLEYRNPNGHSRWPRSITIKPTLTCNMRCRMCRFVSSGDVAHSLHDGLPPETWARFVDDIASFRPYITITGGEPLIYPHTPQLVAHIKARGLFCTMTTNGLLLKKRAPEFNGLWPDAIVVSLDGPPEIHDEIRNRPGAYQHAAEGIDAIRRSARELGGKSPFIIINSSITSFSYRSADAMVEIASDLGVDALNYQHQWSLTGKMIDEHNRRCPPAHALSADVGCVELPVVDAGEVTGVVSHIRQLAARKNGALFITFHPDLSDREVHDWYADPHLWVRRRTPACAWINTSIRPNGDVEPCSGLVCGNIARESFLAIWNNSAFRQHRKRLASAGDFPICSRCCAFFRRD